MESQRFSFVILQPPHTCTHKGTRNTQGGPIRENGGEKGRERWIGREHGLGRERKITALEDRLVFLDSSVAINMVCVCKTEMITTVEFKMFLISNVVTQSPL